ncbi:hypothetical protein JVU11DRAFT_4347 [Chiua virens]|nr:hypothetical protein JVU11DRAFT_4347 [Chiua virens]
MSSSCDLAVPLLSQALRLARCQAAATPPKDACDLASENDVINKTPSREEERLLLSNACIVVALEDLFSWTEKDRTSRTSKLSRVESIRFQRALYRIWLICVLCGPRRFAIPDNTNEDSRRRSEDRIKSRKDQKSILQQFSLQELVQIRKIARFLVSTADWGVMAERRGYSGIDGHDWKSMLLFAGPHALLRCYEDATSEHLPTEHLTKNSVYDGFLLYPLDEIIRAGNIKKDPLGFVGTILDNINGEHDCCRHCGNSHIHGIVPDAPILPALYNESNWDYLKGLLLGDSGFLVPGNLTDNLTEGEAFTQALEGDWSRLLHQLFACRGDEYSQWLKQDWVCMICWMSFIRDTIWQWRVKQKVTAGDSIKQDCRNGYDCQKQRYKTGLAHANRVNHLCKPIEGSDTSSLVKVERFQSPVTQISGV